ncbi:MAG: radical SAM family heme chaperone HemW [Pelotomaculum sp.]|nr:radical SAM family heme chaperone HemW [Pelotomaculum sp.]
MAIGLYVHVPFCVKKCLYCGFVSFRLDREAAGLYLNALLREIELYGAALCGSEKEVSSLFIGGGTPTCLPGDGLIKILQALKVHFRLLPECEVTVEANPGTVTLGGLSVLREAGVNRLSLGVQSFQDRLLKVLGRAHGSGEAEKAVRLARQAGFANLNLDFIFGIPGQTAAEWLETLEKAVELAPEHIAVYGLQLEEGTPLERAVAGGGLEPCPEELELFMYRTAVEYLKKHGYIHYEISNFARPGRECLHNLGYWLNRPYLGLGPAAHSCFRGERFANEPSLERYCRLLSRGVFPVQERHALSLAEEMAETMFLGLRLIRGVDLEGFRSRFGRRAEEVYRNEIARLTGAGLVKLDGRFLALTGKGLPVANIVFSEFV